MRAQIFYPILPTPEHESAAYLVFLTRDLFCKKKVRQRLVNGDICWLAFGNLFILRAFAGRLVLGLFGLLVYSEMTSSITCQFRV